MDVEDVAVARLQGKGLRCGVLEREAAQEVVEGQLRRAVAHDDYAFAVPVACPVIQESSDTLGDVFQTFAFGKRCLHPGRSLVSDLVDRRSRHRPVVVLTKAAVGVDGGCGGERDLGRFDGAAEVGGKYGVDMIFPSPLAELFRLLTAFG